MNRLRPLIVTLLCGGTVLAPALVHAQEANTAPNDLLERARLVQQREILRDALDKNPSLKSLVAEAKRARSAVTSEEYRYQFIWGADATYTEGRTPRLQTNNEVTSNLSRSWVVGSELRRQLSMGTQLELRLEGEYFENSFAGGFNNPILNQSNGFGTTASFAITQPLLRGFGRKLGELELDAAQVDLSRAERAEQRSASELVRDTLLAYAELWYATSALRIEQASLHLAEEQEREAQARVQSGSLAPAEALSLSTQVAERREAVVAVESELQTRTIALLELTGRNADNVVLAASEEPLRLGSPNLSALRQALEDDSLELAELVKQVELTRLRARVAGDDLRPKLDLQGSLRSTGLGNDAGSAVSRTGQFQWVTAQMSLVFESPVGSARKKAERAQADLSVEIAEQDLAVARNRLAGEVRQSTVGIESAERNLDFTAQTTKIAEQAFTAERNRYQLGTGLSIQVQEADDALRRARLREARARVNLAMEEIRLQHLAGGLLEGARKGQLL